MKFTFSSRNFGERKINFSIEKKADHKFSSQKPLLKKLKSTPKNTIANFEF